MPSKSFKKGDDKYRREELAKIHIARKDLGLDDEIYRDMLWSVAKVHSSGDADSTGRRAILEHLKKCGFAAQKKAGKNPVGIYPGKPRNMETGDRKALLEKIEALLAEANRPWSYVDGMAKRMFKTEKVEWLPPDKLHKIVAALVYDAKRHGRKTE